MLFLLLCVLRFCRYDSEFFSRFARSKELLFFKEFSAQILSFPYSKMMVRPPAEKKASLKFRGFCFFLSLSSAGKGAPRFSCRKPLLTFRAGLPDSPRRSFPFLPCMIPQLGPPFFNMRRSERLPLPLLFCLTPSHKRRLSPSSWASSPPFPVRIFFPL